MSDVKRVNCAYPDCGKRRPHHERPDEERGTQTVEVPWNYEGKAYCSMTCAIMGGAMSVRKEWTDEEIEEAEAKWKSKR